MNEHLSLHISNCTKLTSEKRTTLSYKPPLFESNLTSVCSRGDSLKSASGTLIETGYADRIPFFTFCTSLAFIPACYQPATTRKATLTSSSHMLHLQLSSLILFYKVNFFSKIHNSQFIFFLKKITIFTLSILLSIFVYLFSFTVRM